MSEMTITVRDLYVVLGELETRERLNGNHNWRMNSFTKFYNSMRRAAGSQPMWEAIAVWLERHGIVNATKGEGENLDHMRVDMAALRRILEQSRSDYDDVIDLTPGEAPSESRFVCEVASSPAHPGSHRCWKCGTGGDHVGHCKCGGFFLPIICVCDEIGEGSCAQHNWEGRVRECGGVIEALESTGIRSLGRQGYFPPGSFVEILDIHRVDRERGLGRFVGKIGVVECDRYVYHAGRDSYCGVLNFWPSDEPEEVRFDYAQMELVREPITGLDAKISAVLSEIDMRFFASRYAGPDPLLILQARAKVSLADWRDVPEHYDVLQKHENIIPTALGVSHICLSRATRYHVANSYWCWPRPVNKQPTPLFYKALLDQLNIIRNLPNYIES
jgi:hypothetical protein